MLSDSTVWDDFREGKSYALSYIYCRHVEPLYQYGRKFSHDEALIKDTIQEVFYQLIRSRTTLGETDNIRFYLMTAFKLGILRTMDSEKHGEINDDVNNSYELSITYSYEDELISGKPDLRDSIEDVMKVLADVAKVNYRINQEKISIGKNHIMPMRN